MPLAVNFEKWGYISDWTKSTTTTGDYFTYPWSRKNWTALYTNGYQTLNNDIDLSIAPWRINKNAALVNITGGYWYNNYKTADDSQVDNASDQNKMHCDEIPTLITKKNVPFILSYWGGTGTTQNATWSKYWAYKINGKTKDTNNVGGNRYPVCNFRYDKIRICPVIWLISTDPKNMTVNMPSRQQFGGFPSLTDIASYPYCVGVGFEIFIDKSGTWTESPLTIDIDTEFEGNNDENYRDKWYAESNGIHIMRMPYRYNPAGTHYNNMFFGISQSNSTNVTQWRCGNTKAYNESFSRASYDADATYGIGGVIGGRFADIDFNEKDTSTGTTFTACLYQRLTADNYEAFKNAVKKELAYIGLPFTISRSAISTASADDNNLYYPVFDAHRCTTGEYYTGEAAKSLPNYSWQWIYEIDELPPDEEPDPGATSGDIGDLSNTVPNRYSNAGGLQQWVVSQQTLIQLGAYLNGTYLPTSADLDADFKGTDPTQYIVSVQKYPYDIPYQGTSGTIHIGKNSSGLSGYQLYATWGGIGVLPINSYVTEDFGYIEIPYFFEDFRDYQSKILLFMPFIGTVELDPRLYIGTAVKLVYNIDYNTGAVCAEIKRRAVSDDQIERWLTMETKTSTISITVPFMAANMGQYQNQLAALDYSKEMTKIKGVQTALSTGFQIGSAAIGSYDSGSAPGMGQLSAIASGTMQLAANATQLDYIDYQIEHTAPSIGTLSTASAANSFFMDDRARILIVRPQMIAGYDASKYSHTIGNACCKNGKISDFSGLLVCSTAILSDIHTKELTPLQATEQEKKLLKAALQNGIYL